MNDDMNWNEEPIRTEPIQNEPVPTEPIQNEPVPTEPIQNEPVQSESIQDEPVQNEPVQNEPAWNETNQSEPIPPRYGYYQVHEKKEEQDEKPKQEKPRREHSSFGKKASTTVALAVVFGLVAGVVFQGVNVISGKYILKSESTKSLDSTTLLTDNNAEDTTTSAGEEDTGYTASSKGAVANVAEATMPAVVAITTVSVQEIPSFFGYGTQKYQSAGSGSGIIVGESDDELFIATNNHVVSGATTLSVCFIGSDVVSAEEETQNNLTTDSGDINVQDAVSAKIKGTDEENDLAVIAVEKSDIPDDTMSEIKIAQLGNSDELVVGEQVVAIGNALGYGQSVTSGWVSALDRTIETDDGTSSGLIQTDAAINPGNSGGALLNMYGEVIGINSAKYASSSVEGMGYAIPISKAQPILENLMSRKTREKLDSSESAYLGVSLAEISTEAIKMYNMPAGAFVAEAFEGEAAAQAGIQKGDIIEKLDGQKVSDRADLIDKLQYYAPGEEVEIVIARANNGEYVEQTILVTLGSKPTSEE